MHARKGWSKFKLESGGEQSPLMHGRSFRPTTAKTDPAPTRTRCWAERQIHHRDYKEDPCLHGARALWAKPTAKQFISTQCGGCFERSVPWEHKEDEGLPGSKERGPEGTSELSAVLRHSAKQNQAKATGTLPRAIL